MSDRSPMHQQIDTLPQLVREIAKPFDESARVTFDFELCTSVKRIYLVGCGDSYHAPVGAELAFHQLAKVPTQAVSSLTFSRYLAAHLPPTGPNTNLVITVSVSGVVSRTIEALRLARQAGAVGVALTGTPGAPLAQSAEKVFKTTVPPLPDELRGMVVPGVRSYLASQMALYSAAIRIGEVRGSLTTAQADAYRAELVALADMHRSDDSGVRTRRARSDADLEGHHRVCVRGRGADVRRGDVQRGQDARSERRSVTGAGNRRMGAPAIFCGPTRNAHDPDQRGELRRGPYGRSRARGAGDRAAHGGILPDSETEIRQYVQHVLPVKGDVRECFAPLVYSIPGEILAAERAQALRRALFPRLWRRANRRLGGRRKPHP